MPRSGDRDEGVSGGNAVDDELVAPLGHGVVLSPNHQGGALDVPLDIVGDVPPLEHVRRT